MNTDVENDAQGEYTMPGAEAMLAGTLALMTGHAQNVCPNRRMLMALKVRHNLDQLRSHPGLNPQFRAVLLRLCHEWGVLAVEMPAAGGQADRCAAGSKAQERHWLPTPDRIQ